MMDPAGAYDAVFWSAAAENRLTFQRCAACDYIRWPAAGLCPECLGTDAQWVDVAGTGTVWSYVIYHRAYSAALRDAVPYNVALVELDCGVKLLTRLVDFADNDPIIGAAVRVTFTELAGHGVVPMFVPAGAQ
jgi:uncharacterized OB-fold protein